jgi:alanine racemase
MPDPFPSPDASGASLSVDLDALAANYALLRAEAAGAEVAPVVKGDAYGLGAAAVCGRLWREGARSFYVARLAEGEALRLALGPERPATLHVLDGATPASAERLRAAQLSPVLNSLAQVEAWAASGGGPCGVHVDTGMNRLGLRVEEAEALAAAPDRLRRLDVRLLMSHLAVAAEPEHPLNARQLDAFRRAVPLFPDARASLANSAGTFLGADYHFDQVRPGVSLYGGGPREVPDGRLRPVVTLTAPILQVRSVRPGESVGYGAAFTADRPLRVAILAAGYADGVLRSFGGDGYGWLAGARRRYLGRVSMDLIALDVTECPQAQPGVQVELLGPNVLIDDVAVAAGTIPYEILGRLAARATRTYVGPAA